MSAIDKTCYGITAAGLLALSALTSYSPPPTSSNNYEDDSFSPSSSLPIPSYDPEAFKDSYQNIPPGNGKISQSAENMTGVSTAGIPGTDGGNLGCAAAVSMMFQNATGQQLVSGKDYVLSTKELYSSLNNDPRFVRVAWGDARPDDIVVTAQNSRTGKAGHTGIVTANNRIISNSSGGFNGSAPGTIQNNYSLDSWSTVAARNPNETGVFRYVGS